MSLVCLVAAAILVTAENRHSAWPQAPQPYHEAPSGDMPADPGPLATDVSGAVQSRSILAAMKKVADWQTPRVADKRVGEWNEQWTYATLYLGLLSASQTMHDPAYEKVVQSIAEHFQWKLGSRTTHADDQAVGQSYLWLYREKPEPVKIQPLRQQFDEIMQLPDDPAQPVWWWCDALFMATPVWSNLTHVTDDPKYLTYMDHEWHITSACCGMRTNTSSSETRRTS
jgi:rhamnogalacturonyl hydrolase YesR